MRAAGFADDFPLEFLDAETLAELGISTGDSGGGSIAPDLMLLALRCLSNLLEALPSTTAIIMHCGGVPVLVGKMKEIEYIDLAESVLSVLQKVATEYPVHVLRADGLNAVLGYIDFFALSTQRVAVNIAAAALRGLGSVSGAEEMVRTAMPTLERLVGYGDARLVEGVVKALNRVVDWATRPQAQSTPEAGKSQTAEERVESMITPSMLRAILDLLSPNAANTSVVTPQLFTQLLRLLPPVMRTSSKYAHLMVAQWGLVDLVRGVLCGPEPIETADAFGGGEDAEDSAASGLAERVMKMISSRTEEQLIEALNVASDALVGLPKDDMWALKVKMTRPVAVPSPANPKQAADEDVAMDAVHKGANNDGEAAEGKAQEGDEGQAGDSGAVYGEGDEEEDEEGFEDEDDEEEHVVQSTSNTSSVLAERNAKLVDLYKQDKDSLLEFCGALLPVILEVHAATVQMQIRRRCTALIARMLWLGSEIAGEEALRKILGRAKGFGGFVTALIVQGRDGAYAAYPVEAQQGGVGPSATAVAAAGEANKRADQLAVLAAGLQLALLVLARCSDPYLRAFVREGVLHEVEKTAQMATFWLEAQQAPSMEGGAGQDVVMTEAGTQDSKSASGPTRRSSRRLRAKDSVGSSSTAPDSSLAANPLQPSSTTDLLDGMRRMLALLADTMEDRLGQGTRPGADGTSLTSATASGSKSRSASSVLSLGGDRFADKDVREWAVWMCSRILSFYSEKAQTSGTSEVVSVLGEMKALAKKLLVAGKEESNAVGDPAHIRLLHRVAELLAGVGLGEEGKGATTFEVLQSGIAEGLAAFLDANPTSCGGQSSGQSDWARAPQIRMKAFLHVFMNGPWPYDQATTANYGYAPSTDSEKPHLFVPGALGFLVKRLQNLLSRTEQFDVVAAVPGQQTSASLSSLEGVMGSLLASMSNPAMQLTRTLKLKLVAEEPDNVPRTFANYTVAIHAIATFRALEEYLKGRVGGIDFGAPRNSSEDASGAGMASSSAAATTTSNQNGNAAGEASADDVAIKAEPKEERDGDEDVDMGGEGEDEDGESEGDEDAEEANDDDEGGEGEDVDGDHGYDEGEDYDDDQEVIIFRDFPSVGWRLTLLPNIPRLSMLAIFFSNRRSKAVGRDPNPSAVTAPEAHSQRPAS